MSEPNDHANALKPETKRLIDETAQDWFLLLSSDEASDADRIRFAQWRDANPRHKAAFDELCAVWNDIEELAPAFRPSSLRDEPFSKTQPRLPHAGRFRHRVPLRGGVVAACLVLLSVIIFDLPTFLLADHVTAVGEQARVELADGSIVYLNTDTAINVDYSNQARRISLLRGEAQFEVAKQPARPFIVGALTGRATARGTVYTVRDAGDAAIVTVSEGTVEVALPLLSQGGSPPGARSRAILNAGDQVRYTEDGKLGRVRQIASGTRPAWRDGFVAFKALAFDDALAEIDRYRPGRILLLANAEELKPVTARLSIKGIDAGLEALADINGLTVTRLTDYLIVVH